MAQRISFGRVRPLLHEGCSNDCRDLCFEAVDPQGRVVRLTHGVWLDTLDKLNRGQMAQHLEGVQAAITTPQTIHEDTTDPRYLLYYWEPSGGGGMLIAVAVKCVPRRYKDGADQRRYELRGTLLRSNAGEAWVSSAYFLKQPKSRGLPLWP
jgi:hypothetical protein